MRKCSYEDRKDGPEEVGLRRAVAHEEKSRGATRGSGEASFEEVVKKSGESENGEKQSYNRIAVPCSDFAAITSPTDTCCDHF